MQNLSIIMQIFGIEFNFGALISFLIGILAGLMFFLLIYFYAVIKSLNKHAKVKLSKEVDIDIIEIKTLIKHYQENFKEKKLRKELGYMNCLFKNAQNLAYDITAKYFPDSKDPYLELTIDETIQIGHYVLNRIDEMLNAKIIKLFRGMTIKQIKDVNITTNKITNHKLIKEGKVGKVYSITMGALNIINPVYWFRKLVIDNAIKIVVLKIGTTTIQLVGEETYKIYSKKTISNDLDINLFYDELNKEMQKVGDNV